MRTHIFQCISNASLISIGQLCDDDCTAIFNQKSMTVTKNGTTIISGKRNPKYGVWNIELPDSDTEK